MEVDLLMVDLMKNATVFESNCNCFPVHPLENQRKLTRLLFHFLLALHFAHSIGSLYSALLGFMRGAVR